MHAPRAVHACTFFNDNANDDDDYYPLRFARPP